MIENELEEFEAAREKAESEGTMKFFVDFDSKINSLEKKQMTIEDIEYKAKSGKSVFKTVDLKKIKKKSDNDNSLF